MGERQRREAVVPAEGTSGEVVVAIEGEVVVEGVVVVDVLFVVEVEVDVGVESGVRLLSPAWGTAVVAEGMLVAIRGSRVARNAIAVVHKARLATFLDKGCRKKALLVATTAAVVASCAVDASNRLASVVRLAYVVATLRSVVVDVGSDVAW